MTARKLASNLSELSLLRPANSRTMMWGTAETFELPQLYHNLTPQQRRSVREQYVRLQEGKCSHCGADLMSEASSAIQELPLNLRLFPKGFLNHPIHLHHDHNTGMTIGAVHAKCNGVLWQYHGE